MCRPGADTRVRPYAFMSPSHFRLDRFSIRRQFAACRTVLTVAEQIVGLHDLVNLARAFVDDRAFAIPVETPDRILVGVAVRAVDLDGVTRHALRRHGREPLREPGLARVALAGVLQPARSQPEQARRVIVGLHLRDHFLHELVLADLHAERLPLLRVLDARVTARAYQPGRTGRHGVAPLIEREHRDLETFAGLAEHVRVGHLDVGHLEPAGVAREDAPLLLHRPARESLERALDDERAEAGRVALFFLLEIGPGD